MTSKNPFISNGVNFIKTVGHEKQKRLFLQTLANDRLAHGYALSGEEGIGKTTFALELANIVDADPILDLFVIDQDTPILVEDTRIMHSRLALAPAREHKVAIIRADQLTREAASSLLKILEEPPKHSLLFLITANFYGLLPTIASRLQKVIFSKVSDDEVRLGLSDLSLDAPLLEKIVTLAAGRIGFARRLALDENFMEQVSNCAAHYQSFRLEKLTERLLTAEKIAALETPEIRFFLNYSLRRFAADLAPRKLGEKLYTALSDLERSVNIKLAMDNLFLP